MYRLVVLEFRSIRIINLIENNFEGIYLFFYIFQCEHTSQLLSLVDLRWWPVPLLRWCLVD